jgi:hypothetical protein
MVGVAILGTYDLYCGHTALGVILTVVGASISALILRKEISERLMVRRMRERSIEDESSEQDTTQQ